MVYVEPVAHSRSGQPDDESPIVTMTDVARAAGVSKTTVSRYINESGYIGEEARQRIDRAVRELNYYPNRLAQSLNGKSTGNVALVIANMANPLIGEYGEGVEDCLFDHGYNTLICNTKFRLDREVAYVQMLLSKRIDGIIIAPCGDDNAHILEIDRLRIPMVFLTRKVDGVEVDYVRLGNETGSSNVVKHLISIGHRRIAMICRTVDRFSTTGRFTGYKAALDSAGLELDDSLVVFGETSQRFGYESTEYFLSLSNPPTAVYCAVNIQAAGVIDYCRKHQIAIPSQLALAAFESFAELDTVVSPQLTSNDMPLHHVGVTAAQRLLKRIEGSDEPVEEISFAGSLVVRESSVGAPQ